MKFLKWFGAIASYLIVFGCVHQVERGTPPTGRLAIAIHSEIHCCERSRVTPFLGIRLTNKETGDVIEREIEFMEGRRVEYFENLLPGNYTLSEYGSFSLLESKSIDVIVLKRRTTLTPGYIYLRAAVYPVAVLSSVNSSEFWADFEIIE